ncbi:MAG: glycosyltransferase family 4 protein [Sumerlaeia bacterium]
MQNIPRSLQTRQVYLVPHDVEASGAPRVTVDVARMLLAAGLQCTLVFPAKGGLEAQARAEGLPVRVVANPPQAIATARLLKKASLLKARVTAFFGYCKLAWQCKGQKPLFWAGSSVLVEVVLAAFVTRSPVIVHVHEHLSHAGFISTVKILLLSTLATKLVFVSKPTAAPFLRFANKPKIQVIPNRIEAKYFSPPKRTLAFRSELGASPQNLVILSTGFLSHRKGFDLLLKAFALVYQKNNKLRLWIAGTDPDPAGKYERKLKRLAKGLGILGAVRFLGFRADSEAVLANADCFVLASRNEALPLSLAEAMVVGCPVICTNVGGVREILINRSTGLLVEPENPVVLAVAINELFAGPKEKWAQNAQRLAFERFQPKTISRLCVTLAQTTR